MVFEEVILDYHDNHISVSIMNKPHQWVELFSFDIENENHVDETLVAIKQVFENLFKSYVTINKEEE